MSRGPSLPIAARQARRSREGGDREEAEMGGDI
jgi:hypothetical protein